MTITVDQMRDQLLSLDSVRNVLGTTEPLDSMEFDSASFLMSTDVTTQPSSITVHNRDFDVVPEAMLEATSTCGLPRSYVTRTPSRLIEPQVNYWFMQGFDEKRKRHKALIIHDQVVALTKPTLVPFSNIEILDRIESVIRSRYGSTEILVDPKFFHSLARTHLRLVLPDVRRTIEGTSVDNDEWSIGIQLKNSLLGAEPTAVEGYLFRWYCSNGSIDTRDNSGPWSRKSGGQGDEVYAWAAASVDAILGGLEPALDAVQHLVHVPIEGEVNQAVRDVFEQYHLPLAARRAIVERMVESDELTMYGLMQAITATVHDEEIANPAHIDQLMRVGGDLPRAAVSRCDACHRMI